MSIRFLFYLSRFQVEHCRMPALAIALTLDYCKSENPASERMDYTKGDMVAFISGLLLGNDCNVRAWFAQYVRNGQKVTETASSKMSEKYKKQIIPHFMPVKVLLAEVGDTFWLLFCSGSATRACPRFKHYARNYSRGCRT